MSDPWQDLATLLREAKAVPRLRAESIIPSSIYDPLYRVVTIGLAMRACGKASPDTGLPMLNAAKLKLCQFVAIRPQLLPSLRDWISAHEGGERPSLDGWAQFPRGYAADSLHESVLTYLVAIGELVREGHNLYVTKLESKPGLLSRLVETVDQMDTFQGERKVLQELSTMRITLKMLRA